MTKPLARVLMLIPSMRLAGGTERVVHNLSALLDEAGYTVAIASFDEADEQWHFEGGGKRFSLGSVGRMPLPLRWLEYAAQARKLARFKRLLQPDLTISNLWRADLISLLSGGTDRKIAIAHINVAGNPTNRLMVRMRPLVGAVYRRFAKVVAVSAPLAEELSELYKLRPDQCVAIDNFSEMPPATPALADDGISRAVWCGRLVPEKNLAGMIEVWSDLCGKLEKVQLVVIGDGPLRGELEAKAWDLGLRVGFSADDPVAQIVFAGMVARPADTMVCARVLLLSSLAEGMPMILLEALALGLPAIAADCPSGGVRSALSDSGAEATGHGALLPIPGPGDHAAQELWLGWLERAMTDDVALAAWRRSALARAGRFSPKVALERWQATIAEVLA